MNAKSCTSHLIIGVEGGVKLTMKLLLLLFIGSVAELARGQNSCYRCSDLTSYYSPSDECYNNLTASTSTCTRTSTGYCYATFTIIDGLVTDVDRGCGSAPVPTTPACTTSYGGSSRNVETTACTYTCEGNICNNQLANSLMDCPNCGLHGFCDYIQGRCVCDNGYSGTTCQTAPTALSPQECIQCSDATNVACTTSTPCPNTGDTSCAASQARLYDAGGALIETVVSKGCASGPNLNNECSFSSPADSSLVGYLEHTCTSKCVGNGCNNFTPDGSSPTLYCVQCSSTGSGCSAGSGTLVRCPIDQGYCYSRVVYRTVSSSVNNGYEQVSVERGCTNTAITASCKDKPYPSSNGVETTCEESCQTNGCNNRWPNRPRCFQCTSSPGDVASGSDQCLYNPSARQAPCPQANHRYCTYIDQGENGRLTANLADNRRGYPRAIVRGCSAVDIGSTCGEISMGGVTFEQCNKTCTTDDCNHGMGGSSRPATSIAVLAASSLIIHALQKTFTQ